MAYQSAAYYLIVLQGPGQGTTHAVHGTTVSIGRQADNQIVINDHRVSRHHAQLSWRGSGYVLEDLGSANGTWVNGAKVTNPVTLTVGDTVGVSQDVKLLFSDQADASDHTYMSQGAAQGLTGAGYAPSSGAMVPQPPSLPTAPPSEGNQSLMALGVGGLIALVGVLALVAIGAAVYFLSKPSDGGSGSTDATALAALSLTQAAVATPTGTPTPYPTATPYPTYTPYPTDAATATPYPTYTPYPTDVPTATPYPTYTPYPTDMPTYTPYPTYTAPRPYTPPTDQPVVVVPTATPQPSYDVHVGRNVVYEPWGIPTDPDGCNGPYWDEGSTLKRFTVQVLVTNNSKNFIPDHWSPDFVSASGAGLRTCIWYYNNTVVEPGETTDVTFATHLERSDYVRALIFDFPGQTITLCLSPSGNEIPCN